MDCISAGIIVADHLSTPIERVPAAGELVLCDELPLSIGGCAANVAMDLARVGASVGIAGCVGADIFGRFVTETLTDKGVDTSAVIALPDIGTAATLIINVRGEDRRFIHTVGANARMLANMIPIERVRAAKVLYVGGFLLMPALNANGELTQLFQAAQRAGVKTVLDVVLGKEDAWPQLEPLLPVTDVFLPNDHEGKVITGESDPMEQARRFREAGAKTVVITMGSAGTILCSPRQTLRAGVYPTEFHGATGAGDAFDAGYIFGLLQGEDEAGCLKWGSALGASCVRSISATEGVFTRQEAADWIRRHDLIIERG